MKATEKQSEGWKSWQSLHYMFKKLSSLRKIDLHGEREYLRGWDVHCHDIKLPRDITYLCTAARALFEKNPLYIGQWGRRYTTQGRPTDNTLNSLPYSTQPTILPEEIRIRREKKLKAVLINWQTTCIFYSMEKQAEGNNQHSLKTTTRLIRFKVKV